MATVEAVFAAGGGAGLLHTLAHWAGIDTQQSYFYDFWSGIATQLSVLVGLVGLYHKHNCHARRCPRIGKHAVDGTPWCSRHLPRLSAKDSE